MNEEDFKKYLAENKEEVEAYYRKQGGGISSGEWIVPGVPMGKLPPQVFQQEELLFWEKID